MIRMMRIAVLVCILAALTAVGYTQGPPPGGGQGPNAAAFKAFQDKHKYVFQLMRFVGNIREIDQDKKYTLTGDQAAKVLAILKPLRSKPKMTEDQAKKVLKHLKPIFTSKQLNAMARVKPKDAKIVLITDAGGLDRSDVKRGLEIMDANNGEVWKYPLSIPFFK